MGWGFGGGGDILIFQLTCPVFDTREESFLFLQTAFRGSPEKRNIDNDDLSLDVKGKNLTTAAAFHFCIVEQNKAQNFYPETAEKEQR